MPSPIQSSYPGLPFVARLIYFGRVDLALAGRKSAILGELIRAGFDVLGGYVVTTSAFDLLLQATTCKCECAIYWLPLNLVTPSR